MAKQLYDYWFVQFEFPDSNGRPYKSSGGQMVWNNKLKREIPFGWKNTTMADFCIMYQPQTISTNLLNSNGKYRVYGANGIVGRYDQYNHEKSEIAMACRGNSCGTVNRTMPFSWITGNAMVIKIKNPKINNEFIRHAVRYMNIDGAITGSGQPQITRENLNIISMLEPDENILIKFSHAVQEIVNAQLSKIEESEGLVEQRDYLLQLLMNEQVSIKY